VLVNEKGYKPFESDAADTNGAWEASAPPLRLERKKAAAGNPGRKPARKKKAGAR